MFKSLKILIVEDEVLISERLKQIVQGLGHEVISICGSLDAVKKLSIDILPDLALLDIRMNGEDEGIEVAKIMKARNIPFTFITSFSDKATLQATVVLSPVGFIVKPFSKLEIKTVLDSFIAERSEKSLELKSGNKFQKIPFPSIKWINSENVYIEVHTDDDRFLARMKLNDLEASLPKEQFVRVHQSYIVNISKITAFDGKKIQIGAIDIPISKKYKSSLAKLL